MDTDYPRDFEATCDNRSAQVIQLDNGKAVAAVALCAAFSAACAVLAVWAAFEARDAQTEYRVMLNHTMELEAAVRQLEKDHGDR